MVYPVTIVIANRYIQIIRIQNSKSTGVGQKQWSDRQKYSRRRGQEQTRITHQARLEQESKGTKVRLFHTNNLAQTDCKQRKDKGSLKGVTDRMQVSWNQGVLENTKEHD